MASDPPDAPTDAPTAPAPGAGTRGAGRTLLIGVLLSVLFLVGLFLVLPFVVVEPGPAPALGPQPATPARGGLDAIPDAVAQLPDATLGGFADGPDLAVADLLGGPPVVLNFWATWCPPCLAEMPDLQALHEAAGEDLRLVGIDVQDAPSLAEDFVADVGTTYELARDPERTYLDATGGFGMPTTLFVRPDGSVAYRQTGPMTLAQMQDLVAEHLGVEVSLQ